MDTVLRSTLVLTLVFITLGVSPQIAVSADPKKCEDHGVGGNVCSDQKQWLLTEEESKKKVSNENSLPAGWYTKTWVRCSVKDMAKEYEGSAVLPLALDECKDANRCGDVTKTGYDVKVYDQNGELRQTGGWCETDPAPDVQARVAFAQSTVPVASPEFEPNHPKKVLIVGATTYFTARAEPHAAPVALAGQTFLIRSTPIRWHWSFGDGTTRTTTIAGSPLPTQDPDERGEFFRYRMRDVDQDTYVAHIYQNTSEDTRISVTVQFSGQYSLDNGATWQTIPGTISITSPETRREICEIRATLIDPNYPVKDPGTCGDKNYN